MNPIRTNKPTFFADDGEALKSGSIYIGQPNQWPIDFPKTVTFRDSAGSEFTAQQPLRTNSQGRITYNGKAIVALVDGDYSMLIRDHNGVTVNDGYTPFISNSASGGAATADNVTQVGLLLSDIKQFDVTPGETVRNVGKATTLDGLGADWLVVSSTGSAGDDVDIIDFANGTQGRRYQTYPSYTEATVDLGGDFGTQLVTFSKIGKMVSVSSLGVQLTTATATTIAVSNGFPVPAAYRPNTLADGSYAIRSNPDGYINVVNIDGDGGFSVASYDFVGNPRNTDNFAILDFSYMVAD